MAGPQAHTKLRIHETDFVIPIRYQYQEVVGAGAYGMVVSASVVNTPAGGEEEKVAIKKVDNACEHTTFAKRLLRELRILRHMHHENLIIVREVILPEALAFEDLYVVTDLMHTDLASVVKSQQTLTESHTRFFLYQLMRGLKYVHSADVIHRDIKPRNLLVNADCTLKICDFGLARLGSAATVRGPMTEYVCTRWYRAPELLCSRGSYTTAIDAWSVGCVFAELLHGKAIFQGKDTKHQLTLVLVALGRPPPDEIQRIPNQRCRQFVAQGDLGRSRRTLLEVLPKQPHPGAIELIQSLLKFSPEHRATMEAALASKYMEELYCPDDEPVTKPLDCAEFEFERRKLTMEAIRDELILEALQWHPTKVAEMEVARLKVAAHYSVGGTCRELVEGESAYSDDETP